jgi:hypothetical protein
MATTAEHSLSKDPNRKSYNEYKNNNCVIQTEENVNCVHFLSHHTMVISVQFWTLLSLLFPTLSEVFLYICVCLYVNHMT